MASGVTSLKRLDLERGLSQEIIIETREITQTTEEPGDKKVAEEGKIPGQDQVTGKEVQSLMIKMPEISKNLNFCCNI